VRRLEAVVDQAAAHLFFGEYRLARSALKEVLAEYPFAERLLKSIPREDKGAAALPASNPEPTQALR
jgi:hypothetical protein